MLRYAALKSGKGRPHGKAPKVPDVETMPCDSRPGSHRLIDDAQGRTYCRECRRTWSSLDAEARAS